MGEFANRSIRFQNGISGQPVKVVSANPKNFVDALNEPDSLAPVNIDGQLFLPDSPAPAPVVIVVPGSLGVAPSHLSHAATLTTLGIAACVIDPFGARSVTSTVANQAQYSFAASAWDVTATAKMLAARDDIDATRIGAQGHSRGGSAVMTAATRRFVMATGAPALRGVYAAYPWCGQQFLDPDVGGTRVRAVIGDRDEWCLPQQVQAQIHAIQLAGGSASLRIFGGAQHSFDRGTEVELIAEASVSPGAPTSYIDNSGAFIHPLTGEADASLTDRDLMVYGMKAGYGRKGARIGSQPGEAAAFSADMQAFWRDCLLG